MSESTKTAEQLAAEFKSAYDAAIDKVKAIAEQALGEAKTSGEIASKTKEDADEALLKMGTIQEQFRGLEQRLLEGHVGGQQRAKSVGELFTESDKVKEFLSQARPRGRVDMEVKATLTSLTTVAAGSVGDAINQTRLPGILDAAAAPPYGS